MHRLPLLFLLLLPLFAHAQHPLLQWQTSIFWDTVTAPAVVEPVPEKPAEELFLGCDDREFYVHFPGGDTALRHYWREHIRYPDSLRNACVEGTMCVRFLIAEDGQISRVTIIKSLHPAMDSQVVRAVEQMPHWVWEGKDDTLGQRMYRNECLRFVAHPPAKPQAPPMQAQGKKRKKGQRAD